LHLVGFIIRIYHDARSPECKSVRFVGSVTELYHNARLNTHKFHNNLWTWTEGTLHTYW